MTFSQEKTSIYQVNAIYFLNFNLYLNPLRTLENPIVEKKNIKKLDVNPQDSCNRTESSIQIHLFNIYNTLYVVEAMKNQRISTRGLRGFPVLSAGCLYTNFSIGSSIICHRSFPQLSSNHTCIKQ